MAKGGEGVYKIVEVIGSSSTSWEDAARSAVKTASKSLRASYMNSVLLYI